MDRYTMRFAARASVLVAGLTLGTVSGCTHHVYVDKVVCTSDSTSPDGSVATGQGTPGSTPCPTCKVSLASQQLTGVLESQDLSFPVHQMELLLSYIDGPSRIIPIDLMVNDGTPLGVDGEDITQSVDLGDVDKLNKVQIHWKMPSNNWDSHLAGVEMLP